jgi:hypothetical protein
MRARNIKPGFFENEKLAELPPLTRILYIGLWCYADREGRFEWRPKRIKAVILPYDDCDIDEMLMSLHVMTFLGMYDTPNGKVGFIPKFKEHQNPHPHEAKSKLPAKSESNQCHDMSLHVSDKSVECNADSLIPDSYKNTPLPPKGDEGTKPKRKRAPKDLGSYTTDFEKAWGAYPRKDGKRKAFEAWQKALTRDMPAENMPAHIESRSFEQDWRKDDGQFIPHMATWLNRDGWLDEGATITACRKDEEGDFWDVGFYHDAPDEMPKPGEVLP